MATCPHCKGHLTEGHRCPARRRRSLIAAEIAASAVAGGFAGVLLLAAFDPHGQATDMDVISFCVGALLGVGTDRIIRG
jgi:hypothetical protein